MRELLKRKNKSEKEKEEERIIIQNHEFPEKVHPKKKNAKAKYLPVPDIKKDKKRKPTKAMFPKNFLR